MTPTLPTSGSQALVSAPLSGLTLTLARWHFYAGLLVLPFLAVLALSGALYLFHSEIDDIVHRDLKTVAVGVGLPKPPSALLAAALLAHPGVALSYVPPSTPASSAKVAIKTTGGTKIDVHVDPWRGAVLGSLDDKGSVSGIIRRVHSLAYFGPVANGLIEIAAGWSILLVLSGLWLWWQRRRVSKAIAIAPDRASAAAPRIFWRDLHLVLGLVAAAFILFLALTGMPWSIFWGDKVNQLANGTNFGYPAGVRISLPMSDEHVGHTAPLPWSLRQARVPLSASDDHAPEHEHAHGAAPAVSVEQKPKLKLSLDRAVAIFDALGLAPGYAVSLPSGPGGVGVYTGSVYPNDLARQRVVHLDQFSGKVLLDMGYADYGPLGKALEWGINVHLGQQFGLANQLVLLAACMVIFLLCVSGAMMWWRRRAPGTLGLRPGPLGPGMQKFLPGLLLAGGVLFPLVGASMLAMLLFDRLRAAWPRSRKR
jgi:uncharacterized iron-regulated membrane protein